MKIRTGKECKKINCVNYAYYSNWYRNLGSGRLQECRDCKNAYVSQYRREEVNDAK
uniref:Uncharacterized protein n=1 Tax=viral metagenome TaxID=1070528 RepID=A0A6M3KW90_9ZZZZ